MRIVAVVLCAALAGCTSSVVSVPSDANVTEVPLTGSASSYGSASLSGEPHPEGPMIPPVGAPSADGTGAALDQDRINLMQWTLAQQKIDAAKAQADLDDARRQLVVFQPTNVPSENGVNVALYAKQSTNRVGEKVYDRSVGARVSSIGACGHYRSDDDAQRAFLAAGGPDRDPNGLDPDGDGFACKWDPAPYRALN
ncbi:MAG: hypothetical protein QM699_18640 [Amaricoccus sp.]|uniref:hypothetical protein n=1 Tax=Amaricoccus sp. TaxID=1872485 RepID=UPI0039E33596